VIYLDSCALVKLIVAEKETDALTEFLDDRRSDIVSCQLALTEIFRVVRRSCYNAQRQLTVDRAVLDTRLAAAARLLDRIDLVVVDRRTFLAAAALDHDPQIGSLDAIHLACALEIGAELSAFVTYDRKLARAAETAGLPLVTPGV
jgi:predicted nucleic acid-binding protein